MLIIFNAKYMSILVCWYYPNQNRKVIDTVQGVERNSRQFFSFFWYRKNKWGDQKSSLISFSAKTCPRSTLILINWSYSGVPYIYIYIYMKSGMRAKNFIEAIKTRNLVASIFMYFTDISSTNCWHYRSTLIRSLLLTKKIIFLNLD